MGCVESFLRLFPPAYITSSDTHPDSPLAPPSPFANCEWYYSGLLGFTWCFYHFCRHYGSRSHRENIPAPRMEEWKSTAPTAGCCSSRVHSEHCTFWPGCWSLPTFLHIFIVLRWIVWTRLAKCRSLVTVLRSSGASLLFGNLNYDHWYFSLSLLKEYSPWFWTEAEGII